MKTKYIRDEVQTKDGHIHDCEIGVSDTDIIFVYSFDQERHLPLTELVSLHYLNNCIERNDR